MERRELLGGRTFNGETGATWWEGAGGGESEGRRSYLHCSCNSPPPVHLCSLFFNCIFFFNVQSNLPFLIVCPTSLCTSFSMILESDNDPGA